MSEDREVGEDSEDRSGEAAAGEEHAPPSPRAETPRDRRGSATTLVGLGRALPEVTPELPVARPARVWHQWLSTIVGGGRRRRRDSVPPEDSLPELVTPASAQSEVAPTVDAVAWEKIWLATQRRPWRSLAVIPAGPGAFTPRVAGALAEVGSRHLGVPVRVTDATGLTLSRLEAFLVDLRARRGIIALGPVLESPASLALARAADAVVLCLVLGESAISAAEQTIEEVGRERFLGSVLLRP